MAEESNMSEENKKTIIAFVAGLVVGGLLVFVFGGTAAVVSDEERDTDAEVSTEISSELEATNEEEATTSIVVREPEAETTRPTVEVGEGRLSVGDQPAGSVVAFTDAEFPTNEGWVAVRDYRDGQLAGILGAARWNKSTWLLPTEVKLLRATVPGNTYAIVFYTDNGDRTFNLATDVQMSSVMETFRAE